MITAVFMELIVWLSDYLFGKRKHYTGVHYEDTIEIVPFDWHPVPEELEHKALWRERFTRHAESAYLRIPARAFRWWLQIEDEISLVLQLGNYGWKNVPTSEWPEVWKA